MDEEEKEEIPLDRQSNIEEELKEEDGKIDEDLSSHSDENEGDQSNADQNH